MQCLIWDFDNTLAWRPGMWSQCLADLVNAAQPDLAITREQFVPHLSSGFPWHSPDITHHHLGTSTAWWAALRPTLLNALQTAAGLHVLEAATLVERIRFDYTNPAKWLVFDDTRPALESLSQAGWQHVILSNHVPELPHLVAALGLQKHFLAVHTSASLGYEKPHPGAFATVIRSLPMPAERVVMVGDSYSADYVGAVEAGLEAVLVRSSYAACDRFVQGLAGLLPLLQAPDLAAPHPPVSP